VAYRKCEALVLRRIDYSETSLVLTLFTREVGLLRGIAKGAKRSKSLFDAGLEPFVRCVVVYLERESRKLSILTEAAIVETFPGVRESLARMNAAWMAVELVAAVSEEGDPQPRLYQLLVSALRILSETDAVQPLVLAFILQVLALAGFAPELACCANCGQALGAGRLKLSASRGGFVCGDCESAGGRLVVLSRGSAAALRNFLANPLKAVEKVRLSRTMNMECFAATGALLGEILGRPLRSWPWVLPQTETR